MQNKKLQQRDLHGQGKCHTAFPLIFFDLKQKYRSSAAYRSKERKSLLRKGIRIIGRFRTVQVFLQAADHKFMIRDMVKVGGNNSSDHRGTSLDANGKAASAQGIVSFRKPVYSRSVAVAFKDKSGHKRTAFHKFYGIKFPLHPFLIQKIGAVRTVLEQNTAVVHPYGHGDSDVVFLSVRNHEGTQLPGCLMIKFGKLKEILLLL